MDAYETLQKVREGFAKTTDARGEPSRWDAPTLALFAIADKLHQIEFYLNDEHVRARQ